MWPACSEFIALVVERVCESSNVMRSLRLSDRFWGAIGSSPLETPRQTSVLPFSWEHACSTPDFKSSEARPGAPSRAVSSAFSGRRETGSSAASAYVLHLRGSFQALEGRFIACSRTDAGLFFRWPPSGDFASRLSPLASRLSPLASRLVDARRLRCSSVPSSAAPRSQGAVSSPCLPLPDEMFR